MPGRRVRSNRSSAVPESNLAATEEGYGEGIVALEAEALDRVVVLCKQQRVTQPA